MYKKHIDSRTAQAISDRAWDAVEKELFGNGKSLHFSRADDFRSLESNDNKTGIRYRAGHLPITMAMTTLTPLLLFRCFLFNCGLGLCFGWLYRKFGIGYAMIAHGIAHLISDLLMVVFFGYNFQLCAQPRVCSLTVESPVYPRPNQRDISESWDGVSNDIWQA